MHTYSPRARFPSQSNPSPVNLGLPIQAPWQEREELVAPIDGLLALLVTDLEHFTALVEQLGDHGARRLMRTHNRLLRDCLNDHGGQEIAHTGDGFIAVFRSIAAALSCATQMQRALESFTTPETPNRLRMRVGVHAGEPLPEDGRLFGTCVNTAVRVCSAATASHVLVSEVVCLLATGRAFKFAPLGPVPLKGFEAPLRLSELLWRE